MVTIAVSGSSGRMPTTTVKPVCDGQFSFDCGNTVCVTWLEVCDGVDDCGNHADEDMCGKWMTIFIQLCSSVSTVVQLVVY